MFGEKKEERSETDEELKAKEPIVKETEKQGAEKKIISSKAGKTRTRKAQERRQYK